MTLSPMRLAIPSPAAWIQGCLWGAFVLLLLLGTSLWHLQDRLDRFDQRRVAGLALFDRIQALDDQLTWETRYAISRGDRQFLDRHRQLSAELETALLDMEPLFDGTAAQDAVSRMIELHRRTDTVEDDALARFVAGQPAVAMSLLGQADYLAAADAYHGASEEAVAAFRAQVSRGVEAIQRRLTGGTAGVGIGAVLLLGSWFLVLRLTRRWASEQQRARLALSAEIDVRRQAEAALRESHERLQLALAAARAGTWDADVPSGRIAWSADTYRLYGLDPAAPPTHQLWLNLVHPDDRDRIEENFREAAAKRLPDLYDEFRVEHPELGLRWFAYRCHFTYAPDGTPLRALGLDFDVTERKETEEALAREVALKEVTGTLLRQLASDASLASCLDGLVRGIEGLRPGIIGSLLLLDAKGATLSTAAAPSLPAAYSAAIDGMAIGPAVGSCGAAAFRGERVIVEDIASHPNWRPFREVARAAGLAACWSLPIHDANGRVLGTFAFYDRAPRAPDTADIQALELGVDLARLALERHRREDQLRQAQKMEAVGQLTGGLAHDFNNLLAVVIGNLDLLEEQVRGDAEGLEMLETARNAGLRGAELTAQLLAFARRQPLRPRHVEINRQLTEHVKLLRRLLGADIIVQVHASTDLWPVEVDPVQLETALTNLATNARDAMPDGGTLTITTRNGHLDADYAASHPEVQAGDYVVVEVTDSGCGMSPDVARRVFEPFFTTKEVGHGTGLGLSMVFGFVKQSGGHIRLYSEEGQGTTVSLYLPRAAASAADAGVPPGAAEPPHAEGGEVVLVVEDTEAVRRVLVTQLRQLGYQVLEADSGPAAMVLLKVGGRIDLLLTDIVMPGGLNGNVLAGQARALRPDLRVLFTSGYPAAALSERGQLAPGTLLLPKPHRKSELASLVRQALQKEPERALA